MASSNTTLGLQPVSFQLISDVDISPGAASTDATINAGRYTDNPVLWFHGITHTSDLPPYSVRLGYSKTASQSPLNVLGYSGPSTAVTFNTNNRSVANGGIQYGIFPASPALWLAGNASLDETNTFVNQIRSKVNAGLLSLTDFNNPEA